MFIPLSDYRSLVSERQKYATLSEEREREIARLEVSNGFLMARVNQLEAIFSQLVAKEHDIPVQSPVFGKPVSESLNDISIFRDPAEDEFEATN